MLPRIFIGGTGRSGTSIFYEALGCHDQVFAFPQEMRFLVDPHGLMDLIDALTVRYSPVKGREALYEFERLMRVYLAVPQRSPYLGFELANWIGEEFYYRRLDQFCARLTDFEYAGRHWQVENNPEGRLVELAKGIQSFHRTLLGKPYIPFQLSLPRNLMKAVRYFPDREALVELAASFVDDLFLHPTKKNGKKTWCEKTPENIFHLDFLNEIFPGSIFIHIKRDPRGVANSMMKNSWKRAPEDIRDVCSLLRNIYQAWFDAKKRVECMSLQYYEFKFEDIAASPKEMLGHIASLCNLRGNYTNLPPFSLNRVNDWQESMLSQEVNYVEDELGDYIKSMGYTCN